MVNGEMTRKFTAAAFKIYIREEFHKDFDGCTLCASGSHSRVLAINDSNNVIGVLYPVYAREKFYD